MDAKLKAKLIETVEKSYERRDDLQKRYISRTKIGTATVPFSVQQLHHLVYAETRRLLGRARIWQKIEKALAQEAMERIIADSLRRHQRSAEDEKQFLLPGFTYLPARIRTGRESLIFTRASVAQFLAYKDRYERRAEKDQRVMDELRRLAETVQPFSKDDAGITVAEAFDRANAAAGRPRLAVVSPSR